MSMKDRTKKLFADTLQQMVSEMPLEKVRVKDLCARCGADRQTFYYHFRDKYDLIAWIFAQDYSEALTAAGEGYPEEHVVHALNRINTKKRFYRQAFSDRSQNAVSEYVFDYFVQLGTEAVKAHLGADKPDRETLYMIKSHSFACVGHTIEWLNGVSDYTPEEFAHLQYITMPEVLRDAYGIQL